MADLSSPPPSADTGGGVGGGVNSGPTTHAPRWMKMAGILTGFLVVLVVLATVASGGNHGPGRHVPAGDSDPAGRVPPASVIDRPVPPSDPGGHTPPTGGHR